MTELASWVIFLFFIFIFCDLILRFPGISLRIIIHEDQSI